MVANDFRGDGGAGQDDVVGHEAKRDEKDESDDRIEGEEAEIGSPVEELAANRSQNQDTEGDQRQAEGKAGRGVVLVDLALTSYPATNW